MPSPTEADVALGPSIAALLEIVRSGALLDALHAL